MSFSQATGIHNVEDSTTFIEQVAKGLILLNNVDPEKPISQQEAKFNEIVSLVTELESHDTPLGKVSAILAQAFPISYEEYTFNYLQSLKSFEILKEFVKFFKEMRSGEIYYTSDAIVYGLPTQEASRLNQIANKLRLSQKRQQTWHAKVLIPWSKIKPKPNTLLIVLFVTVVGLSALDRASLALLCGLLIIGIILSPIPIIWISKKLGPDKNLEQEFLNLQRKAFQHYLEENKPSEYPDDDA